MGDDVTQVGNIVDTNAALMTTRIGVLNRALAAADAAVNHAVPAQINSTTSTINALLSIEVSGYQVRAHNAVVHAECRIALLDVRVSE